MLRNYIIIAIRNIQNSPVYSSINILGLTIGIVCSLMLFMYVKYEMSYDKFHENGDRIYRIIASAQIQDTKMEIGSSPSPMGPTLVADHSAAENYVRITGGGETLLAVGDERFYEEKIYFTDSSFFSVFSYELLQGDTKTCLIEPNSIVLSKSLAEKLFPQLEAMGQTLKSGGGESTRKVTGIMADPVINSHIRPNGLISYSSRDQAQSSFWGSLNDQTYILVNEGSVSADVNENLVDVYDKYMSEMFSKFGASAEFTLQPMTDIHLFSTVDNELESGGDVQYLYIFGAIALFMLTIACINYMNLATARSISRSKEVGIRKAMGSHRAQLMSQFVTESIVIALSALLLSVIIAFFLIPSFNELAGVEIIQSFLYDKYVLGLLLAIVAFVGFVGGSYPAIYLSKFKAAEVLKGKSQKSKGNEVLRKVLVVAQFSISLCMVVSTWIVFDQLEFLRDKELGFNKDQVVNITLDGEEVRNKLDVIASQLLQSPNVEAVGSGFGVPGSESLNMSGISVESSDGEMIEKIFQSINVDNNFFPTLEIPIVEGRNFLPEIGNDTASAVIVNEQMVKEMGWEEPLGKKFAVIIDHELNTKEVRVVGVVKNFHMRSLQDPIEPMVIHNTLNNGQMIVRIKANQIKAGMEEIESIYKSVITNRPFDYSFLDQDFQDQYETDQQRGSIFAIFSILTIAIACLGLFGLASFTAESRRKEIGVRKVVGASIPNIIFMMSKDFLKLILISMLVAFPLAYYFMTEWLQEFAFRIDIQWTSFLMSALLTLLVAFSTVLYHSLKSAIANPSSSIREN